MASIYTDDDVDYFFKFQSETITIKQENINFKNQNLKNEKLQLKTKKWLAFWK